MDTVLKITERPVRRLDAADLGACIDLTGDRGWSAEENKWRLMFVVSEVYGVDDPAGGLAGIAALTRYGADLAVIGMMVVASRHGRRGLGQRLMGHVLRLAGDAVVYLTATSMGRPLYEQLGFRPVDTSTRYSGVFGPAPDDPGAGVVRPLASADLGVVRGIDRQVFGADRSRLLAELVTFADVLVTCGDPVAGYGAAWTNGDTRAVGPVVAPGPRAATELISALLAGWEGPVRLDVAGRHAALAAWAEARGLTAADQTTLMAHGGELPGDRARLFAPANVAIG